jgi:CubicO group peptidase (beta-lactamase class C family)
MRTVTVGTGSSPTRTLRLRENMIDVLQLSIPTVSGLPSTIGETLAATHADAFVVLHEGEIACEWYAEPSDSTSPHALHSITKSFIGSLAGIIAEQGLLETDAYAATYVPELAVGGYATATVRDLLDMRTGGDYVENHDDPTNELAAMGEIVGWRARSGWDLPDSFRTYAANVARVALHAGPFSYRSTDTEVLGWVLEAAAEVPLAALLEERLLGHLGLEADAELLVDPVGDPVVSGGLSLVPRDLARFGQMLLDGGSVGSTQVVPTMFVKDTRIGQEDSAAAFQARVGERVGLSVESAVRPEQATNGIYRNQFWVPAQGARQLLCLGVHGQAVLIDGDNDVVAVKLSNWPEPQSPSLFTDGLTCLMTAAESLGGRPNNHVQFLR